MLFKSSGGDFGYAGLLDEERCTDYLVVRTSVQRRMVVSLLAASGVCASRQSHLHASIIHDKNETSAWAGSLLGESTTRLDC